MTKGWAFSVNQLTNLRTISTDVPVSVKPQGGGVVLDTYGGIAQECFELRKFKVKLLCLRDNP